MSVRELADAVYEAKLEPDEFERRLRDAVAAVNGPEGEAILELIEWFRRRYPSPLARLQYARRKYEEAERLRPR